MSGTSVCLCEEWLGLPLIERSQLLCLLYPTAYLDTAAEDPEKEATRVAEEQQQKAKENV
jgi:hypothetical protein